MAENKPGNGSASPFGNGAGATSAGASSGAHDFTKNPTGNSGGGGNDFLTNPGGGGGKSGGRDFTKESRSQQSGAPADLSTDSIIAGGDDRLPTADPPASRASLIGTTAGSGGRKPFKLNGGGGDSGPADAGSY